MKRLIIAPLLVLVLVLSTLSPLVAGVTTAIPGVHAVQHTYQIASRRPPCYHGVPEPWCPIGY